MKKNDKRTKQERFLNMRLPYETWEALSDEAKRQDRTMAYLARAAITSYISIRHPKIRGA
jgi:predicted DNA-binding protein